MSLIQQRPIYRMLPKLEPHLPCVALAQLPSPLELHTIADRPVLLKRDDLSGALYGGNKVRKLEFILAEALSRGCQRVITFGATGTHHGLATALYCRELGLACDVLLFEQPDNEHVRQNRAALAAAGARCIPCGSLAATVARFYLHPGRLRRENYFLFAGGSGVQGTLAFVNAALEMAEQLAESKLERLYVACSSGSTLAGLTLGFALAERHVQVIGVQVADSKLGPFDACTPATVGALMQQSLKWLRSHDIAWPAAVPEPTLVGEYLGPGYGHETVAAVQAARLFKQAVGVELDTTYTAKAFAALLDDASSASVGFWNTLSSTSPPALVA